MSDHETTLYQFGLPDDEGLPLTQCVCGRGFGMWEFVLGVERDYPSECPSCHRRLYWSSVITIHEVTP